MKKSREELESRRAQVWEMLMRGVSQPEIARTLGVHRNTIVNDVRVLRKGHRTNVKDTDVHDEIGDIVAKYEEIFKYAMADYSLAEKATQKAQFLEKAMAAIKAKVHILVETGILPKAAQEITGKMVIQGVDVNKASLEELKILRDTMEKQLSEGPTAVNRLPGRVSDN